jgi:ribonuclease HI
MSTLEIYSDGGSRGNPGPAAIGVVILENKEAKAELSEYIGEATNNTAEYTAVIRALKWVKSNIQDDVEVAFYLDSLLVVEQLNQRYKLKNEGLKPLFWQIRGLIMDLGGKITFKHIPREKNKEADRLVNEALDSHSKK